MVDQEREAKKESRWLYRPQILYLALRESVVMLEQGDSQALKETKDLKETVVHPEIQELKENL